MKTIHLLTIKAVQAGALLALAMLASVGQAQSDFDSLGSNEGILKRAQALSTKQQVRIVQKRAVDRDLRFEIGGFYGGVSGGNSYLNTQPYGGMLEFHVTPKFSVGARYSSYTSGLSSEGENQFNAARAAQAAGRTDYSVPEIDAPQSSVMGTLSYYPMYGKLNFFDLTVVQFDFYALAGYGQMQTKNGSSPMWTAGGGVGFWWTQHFSSRIEIRHQSYSETLLQGTRGVGAMIGTVGIGLLL